MKFCPFNWNEVKPNEENKARKGWLRLRLSAPCPVYIQAKGYEALAGFGSSFDLDLSEAVTFRVEAPKGVRVFQYLPPSSAREPASEVYTNIDRMPDESGNLLEVRQGMRQLELMRRQVLRDIRAARDAALPLKPAKPEEPDTVVEPVTEPAKPAAKPVDPKASE